MACPICGKNCNVITPSPGAGVTVTRLSGKGDDMAKVTLSKERWYVTADRTTAVKGDNPEAAFLLVGKGGAIAPEVAAHYGIETYTGESISKVIEHPGSDEVKSRMVTEGTSQTVAENYAAMKIAHEVRESVNASISNEPNNNGHRQAEMMSQGIIAGLKAEGNLAPAPAQEVTENVSTRTKEIPAPDTGAVGTANGADSGGETQTGQAGEKPHAAELELDEAINKTL